MRSRAARGSSSVAPAIAHDFTFARRGRQRAGDVMVVPSSWGRAARHDEPTIGWVSEVAFDREHTDGFGEFYGTESWRQTEDVVY